MINSIDVILYEKVPEGESDAFGREIYTESETAVSNVLVAPLSSADVIASTQLDGKTLMYELYIPKGDDHIWEGRKVGFFGQIFETVGAPVEYIEENVPLIWNRKVQVKRFE